MASGLYGSASEVVREALRLFEAYQSVKTSTLMALKTHLEKSVPDRQAGRVVPMDMGAIKAEGRARRSKQVS